MSIPISFVFTLETGIQYTGEPPLVLWSYFRQLAWKIESDFFSEIFVLVGIATFVLGAGHLLGDSIYELIESQNAKSKVNFLGMARSQSYPGLSSSRPGSQSNLASIGRK